MGGQAISEDAGLLISNGIMTFLFVWCAVIIFVMMMIWNYRSELRRKPWKEAPLSSARTFGGEIMGDLKYYFNGIIELYQRRNHPEWFNNIHGESETESDITDEYQIEIPEKFSYQNA